MNGPEWNELTPEQLEILFGLCQPFEASLTEDDVWVVYHEATYRTGYGQTMVEALLNLADQLGKQVGG